MTLRRDFEEKFQSQRDDLSEKLKKALSELSTKSMELDTFSSEGKTISENLKSMQKIMDLEAVSKRNEISELKDLLESSRNDKTKLLVELEDVKLSNSKLERILIEKENFICEQDDLRLNLEGDVKRLRDDLARYVRMCAYVRSMSPYILP
jgi:chromosome segregation ATPase